MPFTSRPLTSLWTLLLLLLAAALFSPGYAEEPAAEVAAATPAADATPAAADRGSVSLNGRIVFWNAEQQRFEPPSAELRAKMEEAFRTMMQARAGGDDRLRLGTGEVQVERLESGLLRARLTADHVSFAVVRLDENGEPIHQHAEGVEGVRQLLSAPATGQAEVE